MEEIKNKPELTAGDFPPAIAPFYENFEGTGALRMASTIASVIAYQAMAPRLRVKYPYDYDLSMLLSNLLVIGPSGCGKSIIRNVVNILINDLLKDDIQQRRLQRACADANKRKGSASDKDEEPLVCIRLLQNFTLPIITQYADYQYRLFGDYLGFFLFADELATLCETKRNKTDLQAVARTAFSYNELFCKDTLYKDGYNALTNIVWNSVLLGQEASLKEYIPKKGLLCGDASRHIIVNLGGSLGDDAPIFHPLTEEQQKEVDDTIQKLKNETFQITGDTRILQPIHEVDMSWLNDDVNSWCNKQRIEITRTGSRAHNSFYVRASVLAFRLCTIMYHLWNEKKEHQEKVRKCYWYFAQNILDSQLAQWGEEYESALGKDKEAASERIDVYSQVPDPFTREWLKAYLQEHPAIGTPARQFIYNWKKKHWIFEDPDEKDKYHKMYDVKA